MHVLLLLCIIQQTQAEVPSFTISKDMTGAKFNKLSNHRGTARCAMLVNSCCFTSYGSNKGFKQQK